MIFDGVCQAIKELEAVGGQPIKILLRGTYRKSSNDNASSRQAMCIIYRWYREERRIKTRDIYGRHRPLQQHRVSDL